MTSIVRRPPRTSTLDRDELARVVGGLTLLPDCPSPPDLGAEVSDLRLLPDCPSPPDLH